MYVCLITSLAKGGYIFGSVGLSVCREKHYSKTYEWISLKFYGVVARWYNEELIKLW